MQCRDVRVGRRGRAGLAKEERRRGGEQRQRGWTEMEEEEESGGGEVMVAAVNSGVVGKKKAPRTLGPILAADHSGEPNRDALFFFFSPSSSTASWPLSTTVHTSHLPFFRKGPSVVECAGSGILVESGRLHAASQSL